MPKMFTRCKGFIIALLVSQCVLAYWLVKKYGILYDTKLQEPKTTLTSDRNSPMLKGLDFEKLSLTIPQNDARQLFNSNDKTIIVDPSRSFPRKKINVSALDVPVKQKLTSTKQSLPDVLQVITTKSPDECSPFKGRATEPRDQIFQPIAGSESFAYSAFAISQASVRLVFLHKKSDNIKLFSCQYKHRHDSVYDIIATVPGSYLQILDDHQKPYTPAFLTCSLPRNASIVPELSVAVTYGRCQYVVSNLLPVHRLPGQIAWEFTVCVAPFHSNFSKAEDLIEMVELNRILGAKQFYFYNASCSPLIAQVLAYYRREGLVNLIQWHLPYHHDKNDSTDKPINIHYIGQNAAVNDCLYRNRNRSKYVVITDIDEFIVPHNPNITTWSQFVKSRLAINPNASNFLVRSSYYRKEWISTDNKFKFLNKAKTYNSIPLQNIQREERIFDYKIRSKYIANPLLIAEGGIHYVHRLSNSQTDFVPTSEAIVHHYRKLWRANQPPVRLFDDIVVRKYGDSLIQALEKVRKALGLRVT